MSSGDSYERQLQWRLKQTELGKSNEYYRYYVGTVPKGVRRREDPSTPDPYDARMSKRQFEGRVKAWRKSVKVYAERNRPEQNNKTHHDEKFAMFLYPNELIKFHPVRARIILDAD